MWKHLDKKRGCCTNAPIDSLRSPLPPLRRGKLRCHNPSLPRSTRGRGPRAVNVNQSHVANARVLGTFSHTTCFPISFVLRTCFLDRSASGGRDACSDTADIITKDCCMKFSNFVQQSLLCVLVNISLAPYSAVRSPQSPQCRARACPLSGRGSPDRGSGR